jgi:hypothetical protein
MLQQLQRVQESEIFFPPIQVINKCIEDGGERSLTYIYSKNGKNYYIDCKTSHCKTMYIFQESVHGVVCFHKDSESFISSTLQLDNDYILFLQRAVKSWKKHFKSY